MISDRQTAWEKALGACIVIALSVGGNLLIGRAGLWAGMVLSIFLVAFLIPGSKPPRQA